MVKKPNPSVAKSTRADDERLLAAVRIRAAGGTSEEASRAMGKSKTYTRAATNRVRDDDTAYSGEDVAGAYW